MFRTLPYQMFAALAAACFAAAAPAQQKFDVSVPWNATEFHSVNAQKFADRPAFIMATSGEAVTYGELESRSNRLAHLLRAQGLQRLGHYAVFMENNSRYVESCVAGERSGLYYTCINGYLQADELAYILNNSASKVLITSEAKRDVALAALAQCPGITLCIVVDGPGGGSAGGAKIARPPRWSRSIQTSEMLRPVKASQR